MANMVEGSAWIRILALKKCVYLGSIRWDKDIGFFADGIFRLLRELGYVV